MGKVIYLPRRAIPAKRINRPMPRLSGMRLVKA